ncbi:MAG: hypothetical protein ACXABY_06640, partial [Candidatus Thorarchaeota archaeon]
GKDSKTKADTPEVTKEQMEQITQTYVELRMTRGPRIADAYIKELMVKGVIPKEFPIQDNS